MMGTADPSGGPVSRVPDRRTPPPVGCALVAPIGILLPATLVGIDRRTRPRSFCSGTPPLYTIGGRLGPGKPTRHSAAMHGVWYGPDARKHPRDRG
jgi:hypothetical protein